MNSTIILNFIEHELNNIALTEYEDIIFKGSLDIVDNEWRRKLFNIPEIPFALVPNEFRKQQGGNEIIFRYQIYAMAFEQDRQKIINIFDKLDLLLENSFVIDNWNLNITPNNFNIGEKFSEGSGSGLERFEVLYTFNGTATSYYSMDNDLEFNVDGVNLPILSFKYDNGRVSYINKENAYLGQNNHNLNTNVLVVQASLGKENNVVQEFLTNNQKVNINKHINLKVGEHNIIDTEYEYEGFSFSSNRQDASMNVFLYFSYKKDDVKITINGDNIPILDFSISTAFGTISKEDLNSDTIKEIYTSKARSYAFNVSEELGYEVFNLLKEDLLEDNDRVPSYQVMLNLYGVELVKDLILNDITKETKETGKSVLRLVMSESGEYDG